MDLGIARPIERSAERTRVLGTAEYMSPEQVTGLGVGAATDIYALAVLTYRMLIGRPPFEGDTVQVLMKHVNEPPPPMLDYRPGLPEPVYQAVNAALAKDPTQRPASARDFVEAFRHPPPIARRPSPPQATPLAPVPPAPAPPANPEPAPATVVLREAQIEPNATDPSPALPAESPPPPPAGIDPAVRAEPQPSPSVSSMPRIRRRWAMALAGLAVLLVAAVAVKLVFFNRADPTVRQYPALAWDDANGAVVLFGGAHFGGGQYFNDTWTWDGKSWTQRHPKTSPRGRQEAGLSYDPARRQLVLFGGNDRDGNRNDTWIWNGGTWTEKHPKTAPPRGSGRGMIYDSARQQIVLFAGSAPYKADGNEIWTWDGETWTQQRATQSPPTRCCAATAYDAARQQVVIFGGCCENQNNRNDTWTWDGRNWTRRQPGLSPKGEGVMAYDADRQQVVLLTDSGNTWTWDGANWTEQHPRSAPRDKDRASIFYDPSRHQVLVFSGSTLHTDRLHEIWAWDGQNWTLVNP